MPSLIEDHDFAAGVADIVKAVGHPVRLRIIALLCRNDATVSGIAHELGIPPAIVSQQLRILRLSHLVDASRADGFALYRLAEPRLANLVDCLEGCTLHGRRAAAIAETPFTATTVAAVAAVVDVNQHVFHANQSTLS